MGSCLGKPSKLVPASTGESAQPGHIIQRPAKAKRKSESRVLGGASSSAQGYAGGSSSHGYQGPIPTTIVTAPTQESQRTTNAASLPASAHDSRVQDAREAAHRAAEARMQGQGQGTKGGNLAKQLKQQQNMSGQALRKAESDAERRRRDTETLVYD